MLRVGTKDIAPALYLYILRRKFYVFMCACLHVLELAQCFVGKHRQIETIWSNIAIWTQKIMSGESRNFNNLLGHK